MAKKKEEIKKKEHKNLDAVLKDIRKTYGEESIMTFDDENIVPIERRPTGIMPLDRILGGGLPKGRICEIYGPESSGKTTICLKAIAQAQANGETCAFIDMEHALDPVYAQALGVDMKALLLSQPDSGEMALDIAESLMLTGEVSLIAVDSVAALTPQAEIDGDIGEAHVGLLARLMSQAMRKISLAASSTGCTIVFINQIREKVGVSYGSPETTPGGRALKFFASVRMDIRRKDRITKGVDVIGNKVAIKTVKNKVYPPFKECSFNILFAKGPDVTGCLVDEAVDLDIVSKAGAWFTYNGQRFQGRDSVVEYFDNNKEELEALEEQIREMQDEGRDSE